MKILIFDKKLLLLIIHWLQLATMIISIQSIPMIATAAENSAILDSKDSTKKGIKKGEMQGGDAPENARDPNENSGGFEYRGMSGWEETDEITFSKIIADQLEYRSVDGGDTLRWDTQGWRGTDYKKFWFKFEGEDDVSTNTGEFELQTLYSYSISAFWDMQFGARFDRSYGNNRSDNRSFVVVGLQGLAPYWFELEPAIFVDKDGNVSARMVGTYDLLISQRLILQPRMEFNLSFESLPKYGVGDGLNDLQFSLRLRYEFKREFAPYIGIEWQRRYGETADLAAAVGDVSETTEFVTGFRVWF